MLPFDLLRSAWHGRKVTVMGLGRFGGGIGAARFLAERGAEVTVIDSASAESLADSIAALEDLPIARWHFGEHRSNDLLDAELIVASPAVRPSQPVLRAAIAAGVPVATEIALFWAHCPARIAAVTGSVGKSTTATALAAILGSQPAGRCWLGGNLGGSLLPSLPEMTAQDWVVLEVSSFQLEYLRPYKPQADLAILTNICPNHLDWHGSFEAYRQAKHSLLEWQNSRGVAVLNADDQLVASATTSAQRWWFGHSAGIPGVRVDWDTFRIQRPAGVQELRVDSSLEGKHHRRNLAAAATAGLAVGVPLDQIQRSLSSVAPLPHRFERLEPRGGRTVIDDSKATTPEAAIAAIQSLTGRIHLIVGGADKGVNLAALADAISQSKTCAYLTGSTAPHLAQLLTERGVAYSGPFADFDTAIAAAWRSSLPDETLLLSPGCASFGQFRDYRERGLRFAELLRRFDAGTAAK